MIVATKTQGHTRTEYVNEQLTTTQEELGPKGERDAFDTLFDYGPDKLSHVKSSLLAFCNKHLNKINLEALYPTQFVIIGAISGEWSGCPIPGWGILGPVDGIIGGILRPASFVPSAGFHLWGEGKECSVRLQADDRSWTAQAKKQSSGHC